MYQVELQFIIPVMHMKYFLINEQEQTVQSLLLPKISTASSIPKTVKTEEENIIGRKMKTPILMASSEGEEEGIVFMESLMCLKLKQGSVSAVLQSQAVSPELLFQFVQI